MFTVKKQKYILFLPVVTEKKKTLWQIIKF